MADTMLKYQCPACTGPMHFDAEKQMVVCDYCGAEYPESHFEDDIKDENTEKVDWKTEGNVKENEVLDNQSGFICSSCGAEVISDGNTAATECMYCGNPIVLTDNVSGMVKPDLVIPFKIDKDAAEKKLKAFYNKKFLLPSAFKDQNRIKKIAGMYVPFWLFSGKGDGYITFDGTTSRVTHDGDYKVTTTKHYDVTRAGTVDFEKISVDASLKMEDNYMDGLEPYNYEDLTEFSPSYMAGYFADKFDVSVDECEVRAKSRVINSTTDVLRDTVKGYSSVSEQSSSVELITEDVKYAMLPVWMLNTKFEDKMYHFAINGQTGKVSGDLPIDKMKKKILFWVITAIAYIPFAILGYNLLR